MEEDKTYIIDRLVLAVSQSASASDLLFLFYRRRRHRRGEEKKMGPSSSSSSSSISRSDMHRISLMALPIMSS